MKTASLSPKHFKILELIEEGSLSLKEIAKAVNLSYQYVRELHSGSDKTGQMGELFQSEMNKITSRNASRVKHLVKDNQRLALLKMNEYLRELQTKKADPEEIERITTILNSLSKSGPSVEIGSFSIHKGLTAEEMIHEFKRLGSIARFSLIGKGVSSSKQGGPGTLPLPLGHGSSIPEE